MSIDREDKAYFIMESRKPMPYVMKCIRQAKKIHITKLRRVNALFNFEKNPANTMLSTIEGYAKDIQVEIVMKILHAGEYNTDNFLEGIRYAMKMRGVSIKELARKTGFSPSQTVKHIQGYADMHYYQMEAFCKVLRIKISFRNKLKG